MPKCVCNALNVCVLILDKESDYTCTTLGDVRVDGKCPTTMAEIAGIFQSL